MSLDYSSLKAYIDGLYDNDNDLSPQEYNDIINYILANGDIENAPRALIQVRRGDKADLPTLAQGELGFTLDTEELFIGGLNGNIKYNPYEIIDITSKGAKCNANYYDDSTNKWYEDSDKTIEAQDDTSIIQNIIDNFTPNSENGDGLGILIPSSTLYHQIDINKQGISFIGVNSEKSFLKSKNENSYINVRSNFASFKNIGFLGYDKLNNGLNITGRIVRTDNCEFSHFDKAIVIASTYYNSIGETVFNYCNTGVHLLGTGGANANHIGDNCRFKECQIGVNFEEGYLLTVENSSFEQLSQVAILQGVDGNFLKTSGNYFEETPIGINLKGNNNEIGLDYFSSNRIKQDVVSLRDSNKIVKERFASSDLTFDGSIGDTTVDVVDGSKFEDFVGRALRLFDDVNSFSTTLSSISGNTLTLNDALDVDITTSNNGYVKSNKRRLVKIFGKHKTYQDFDDFSYIFDGNDSSSNYRFNKELFIQDDLSVIQGSEVKFRGVSSPNKLSFLVDDSDNIKLSYDGNDIIKILDINGNVVVEAIDGSNVILKDSVIGSTTSMSNPVEGAIAYENGSMYFYDGASWQELATV